MVIYLTERDVSSHQSHIPFKQCHATLLQPLKPPASRSAAILLLTCSEQNRGRPYIVHATAVNCWTHLFHIQQCYSSLARSLAAVFISAQNCRCCVVVSQLIETLATYTSRITTALATSDGRGAGSFLAASWLTRRRTCQTHLSLVLYSPRGCSAIRHDTTSSKCRQVACMWRDWLCG